MAQLTKERKEAYVEVLEILKHMDEKYTEKIPTKLIEFFKDNCSAEYNFVLDVPLEEKELKIETINLLAMLNLNYWCEDEEHKKQLLMQYQQNEIKIQEELLEKYSYENLFKNRKNKTQDKEEVENNPIQMIQYEETLLKRIVNKIKNWVSKIFK